MSTLDRHSKRIVMKNVRECVLSFALSIIPNQITNHSKLEKLTLRRSKITEIIGIFTTNDVEYRKLISSFFETDLYINEITDVLSFNHLLSTQDDINEPIKKKSKLKLKIKHPVLISSKRRNTSS